MLTKGSNKFDCLIKEMLFTRKLKPSLNVQADSIRAKVFTVNPLLSPPGGLFFSSTFEGGLNREGGLKREGGGAYLI